MFGLEGTYVPSVSRCYYVYSIITYLQYIHEVCKSCYVNIACR